MDFESRFRNWLRWCYEGYREPSGSCGSAEKRWNSPQIWDDPAERLRDRHLVDPVDIWDALRVQQAFYGLPDLQRRVIKFLYFKKWRRTWVAQKLGCHETDLSEKLNMAKRMLRNRVDMLDLKAHSSSKNMTGNREVASAGAAFP